VWCREIKQICVKKVSNPGVEYGPSKVFFPHKSAAVVKGCISV